MRKSALKQKEYEIKTTEAELLEKDFFSTEITRTRIKKRKDHIDRVLLTDKELC